MNEYIKMMEAYAQEHHVPIMQEEGINFLCDYVKTHHVKKILEIGSAIGYSAIRMALMDETIHVVTIERDEERYLEAVKNIALLELENRITIYHMDAFDFESAEQFDLLFIDAAKAQYIKFFEKFKHNVTKDGAIITCLLYTSNELCIFLVILKHRCVI